MKKLLFLVLGLSVTVQAQNFSVDKNDRIEKTLIEQDQLIKDLQREVRQLRGDNEQINHQLQQLQQNQRDAEQRLTGINPPKTPSPITGMTGMNNMTGNLNINNGMGMSGMGMSGMGMNSTPPSQTPVLPALSLADPKTTTAPPEYQQAFDLLQRGHYDKAIPAFDSFVKQSPTGDYADNAQYWLGEAYYSKRDFVGALAAFKKLVDNYPDSPKKSHALLKIGFSYDELGDKISARQALEQVRKDFPSTNPARLAEERLKKLRQ
jgi:tol-pal system protein YbgF